MDVLAEVLGTIKLDAAVFFYGEFSAPWSIESPEVGEISRYLTRKKSHVMIFHTIVEGKAVFRADSGQTEEAPAGSIILFPHGNAHFFGNGPSSRPSSAAQMLKNHVEGRVSVARVGGGGDVTKMICGFLTCDSRLSQPMLSSLPHLLVVPIRPGTAGDWIHHSLHFLVETEDAGEGHELVVAKLSEVLILETLRQYFDELPADHHSWIAGIRDPFVGRALAEIHKNPEHPWTLADLGREIGLSRTRLAERFTQFVGQSPMAYLTEWRLCLGSQLLRSTDVTVAEIATRVGYGSEASFSRAFKKEFGTPPAQFRRLQRVLST